MCTYLSCDGLGNVWWVRPCEVAMQRGVATTLWVPGSQMGGRHIQMRGEQDGEDNTFYIHFRTIQHVQ